MRHRLLNIYDKLFDTYGPQHWWPADDPLECMIGAVLTQNTSWKNVETALGNLKSAFEITIENIDEIETATLGELIKPSGYYNQKAIRIKNLVKFIIDKFDGRIENMYTTPAGELRSGLLGIRGIGPETADTIILYALNKPKFIVDKYTYRLMYRHGIVKTFSYNDIQEMMESSLKTDKQIFNEFHALIVKAGKEHCGKKAFCRGCPLEDDPHELSGEII